MKTNYPGYRLAMMMIFFMFYDDAHSGGFNNYTKFKT